MLEHVGAVLEDLAGRRVEGDEDVGAGLVAGGLDPGQDRLQRRLVGVEVGGEADEGKQGKSCHVNSV